jgi:hypothetical protein
LVVSAEGAHVLRLVATDAAGLSALLDVAFTLDRSAPAITAVNFTAYTTLELSFSEPVLLGQSADYALTPAKPAGMAVLSVEQPTANVVRLHLSKRHLPLPAYVVSADVSDLAGNTALRQANFAAATFRSRVGFLTNTLIDGNIGAYSGTCAGTTPLEKADCLCANEASAAGPQGTFRAVLGDAANEQVCHIRGLSGTQSGGCGLGSGATLPVLGGLIRTDGEVLSVAEADEFTLPNPWITSFVHTADGVAQTTAGHYNTGCAFWTTTSGSGGATNPANTEVPGRQSVTFSCSTPRHVLCVQTDSNGFAIAPAASAPAAKRVFLSSLPYQPNFTHPSGATGALAADAICNDDAASAGLDGAYVAWLSDASNDAYCRAASANGTKSGNCGQLTLPQINMSYQTTLGLPLATSLDDFATGSLASPFMGTATGVAPGYNLAWTGTTNGGVLSNQGSCNSWTGSGGTNNVFLANIDWPTANAAGSCSILKMLVCVEK